MKWTGNRIIAIILFVFSLWYVYLAFQIPQFSIPRPIDSDLFPKVLGLTMMLLSAFLFFEKKGTDIDETLSDTDETLSDTDNVTDETEVKSDYDGMPTTFYKKPWFQVGFTLFAISLYIMMFVRMGFILSTTLFIMIMTYFYGYRNHPVVVLTAILVPLILYFGLSSGLSIRLPKGWLPF